MTEEHPVAPLGEYGWSKQKTEELAAEWRKRGMSISLFRPRLIIGPGRLGILEKLFKLIDWNLAGADDRLGQEPLSVHLGVRLRRSGRAPPGRPACRTRPTISARSTRRR